MNIAFVTHSYLVDMTRRKLELIADAGHDVSLITPKRWPHDLKEYELEENKTGKVNVIPMDTKLTGKNFLYFFRNLRSTLNGLGPDIIHIEEEPYSFAAFQTCRQKTRLGSEPKIVFFTWENINKNLSPPLRGFESYVHKKSDAAIAGNKDAKAILRERGFDKPVLVVPQMGVDTDFFRVSGKKPKKFTVGYVGRLTEEKGVSDFISACSELDVSLILVGGGPDRRKFEKMSVDLEVNVEFAGSVSDEEVVKYMNKMHCLALPSRSTDTWKEQFGHVIIEAMSCGVPVIGSDSGAIPEVVGDGGIIFKEGDIGDLREGILTLMNNESKRKGLSKICRKRVENNYTWERVAFDTMKSYEGIV